MNTQPALSIAPPYSFHCSGCNDRVAHTVLPTFADCPTCGARPLVIHYTHPPLTKAAIAVQEPSMWRYRRFLPIDAGDTPISLGEGWTPLIALESIAQSFPFSTILLKDESLNPTGSFKARGLSLAITKAKRSGVTRCIIPTAGNAGGALSAYCAKAGLAAIVVMPSHTPKPFQQECRLFGAEVVLVDGLISDCARKVASIKSQTDCFDVSTMKEPYRLEGKKTLGYEIAEQYDWKLPDLILYPTGGGTGLIGIWKAFKELQALGWIQGPLPKMIAVQATHCQPIADTFYGHQPNAKQYKGQATIANGLAVPNPFAEALILQVLQESGGTVLSVTEEEITRDWKVLAEKEGLLVAPEGAALLSALKNLSTHISLQGNENVLLLNTGSGYKYLDSFFN